MGRTENIIRKHQDQIQHREPQLLSKTGGKVGTPEQGTGSYKQDVEAPPPPHSAKRPQTETIQADDQLTETVGKDNSDDGQTGLVAVTIVEGRIVVDWRDSLRSNFIRGRTVFPDTVD